MTTEREAMTLERQAFEKWARGIHLNVRKKEDGVYSYADTILARAGWKAAIDHLSRAAEPVAFRYLMSIGREFTWTRWLEIGDKHLHSLEGCKVEYAYANAPEPARDADTWRKYCDDAAAEAIKKYAAKGDVEGAVLFMRITCGPPGKITQKEIDAAMAQESGDGE